MAHLSAPVPGDLFQDNEKWIKFFSKRSLILMLFFAIPSGFVCYMLYLFGFKTLGLIILAAAEVLAFFLSYAPLPVESRRCSGGGQYRYEVIGRKILRRRRRAIYVRNFQKFNGRG